MSIYYLENELAAEEWIETNREYLDEFVEFIIIKTKDKDK